MELKLKQQVYHKKLYSGTEPFIIVGIREHEVELQGDFSGGTHNVTQTSWMPIEGLVTKYIEPQGCIEMVQHKRPFYGNIIDFIKITGGDPDKIFIKAWDDKNEHLNVSSLSGTSHIAISTPNGIVKLRNHDWVLKDNEGNYFVFPDEEAKKEFKWLKLPSFDVNNGAEQINSMKQLDYLVYPSEEKTIHVTPDEEYGGAHHYAIQNCLGFNDGKTTYVDEAQTIQFVQKNDDGSMTAGVQSEQLAYVLLDRCVKLNARFPSAQNEQMIAGLEMFLKACKDRVQERIDRCVMGELKK